jgi:hypothetical protein
MAIQDSALKLWDAWMEVEPITDRLEADLLKEGVEAARLFKTKIQGTTYCRIAGFFLPPLENFRFPSCASQCLNDSEFDEFPECDTCFAKFSNKVFISAVGLDESGQFKAVKLRPVNECYAAVNYGNAGPTLGRTPA